MPPLFLNVLARIGYRPWRRESAGTIIPTLLFMAVVYADDIVTKYKLFPKLRLWQASLIVGALLLIPYGLLLWLFLATGVCKPWMIFFHVGGAVAWRLLYAFIASWF